VSVPNRVQQQLALLQFCMALVHERFDKKGVTV
jgi:hypothetical protein